MRLEENIQRIKEVMGLYEQKQTDCQQRLNSALQVAIKKWKDWLFHPETKNKFQTNHKLETNKVDEIFDKYSDLFSRIEVIPFSEVESRKDLNRQKEILKYLNKKKDNLWGVTLEEVPNVIFVNCEKTDQTFEDTIEHEMSHLIDFVYPKNPISKSTDLYNNQKISERLNKKNLQNFFERVGIKDETEKKRIIDRYLSEFDYTRKTKKYFCNPEENMVGIQKLREILGKKIGEDINAQEILPYFTFKTEDFNYDVKKLVSCWIFKGFPEIDSYLNELNQFVKTNSNKNISIA